MHEFFGPESIEAAGHVLYPCETCALHVDLALNAALAAKDREAMVDALARAIAGEVRCYCPDDWRQPPLKNCPQCGEGEWPEEHHRRVARRYLAALGLTNGRGTT